MAGRGEDGGRERCPPYHLCGNAHLVEFLLVVGAGFGAVVCDEDELLPCESVSTIYQPLRPVASNNTIKYLYFAASLESRLCPRTGDLPTIVRLCFSSYPQPAVIVQHR